MRPSRESFVYEAAVAGFDVPLIPTSGPLSGKMSSDGKPKAAPQGNPVAKFIRQQRPRLM